MRGITRDCLLEMLDRKLIYVFGIATLLTILVVLYSGTLSSTPAQLKSTSGQARTWNSIS